MRHSNRKDSPIVIAAQEATAMMIGEYQVQKAGLAGVNWTTVCRAAELKAREVFHKQVKLYSVGRFRLLNDRGEVIEERKAALRLFCD
ncbi:MAG: hypothetical protein L0Z53_08410 [Acidobacteriales bacterium]|nr:hypothetical protein [Terriglobales bacterium]